MPLPLPFAQNHTQLCPERGEQVRAPNTPFLPDIRVRKCLKTNYRLPLKLHGMEEVVGSIPTRSTNFNYLY
jgi:hypothetical protein